MPTLRPKKPRTITRSAAAQAKNRKLTAAKAARLKVTKTKTDAASRRRTPGQPYDEPAPVTTKGRIPGQPMQSPAPKTPPPSQASVRAAEITKRRAARAFPGGEQIGAASDKKSTPKKLAPSQESILAAKIILERAARAFPGGEQIGAAIDKFSTGDWWDATPTTAAAKNGHKLRTVTRSAGAQVKNRRLKAAQAKAARLKAAGTTPRSAAAQAKNRWVPAGVGEFIHRTSKATKAARKKK